MRAYALMQHAASLDELFLDSPNFKQAPVEFHAIRRMLLQPAPSSYRGIGRHPFSEYPDKGPGWQGTGAVQPDPEPRARASMLTELGVDDNETPYPRSLLAHVEQAYSVYEALSHKSKYEIVELCLPPDLPRILLGFDVGYWGGGNFSILCDTAIWPTWRVPSTSALDGLAHVTRHLNSHALFPSERSAREYRKWYAKQPWSEGNAEEFRVIAVGRVETLFSVGDESRLSQNRRATEYPNRMVRCHGRGKSMTRGHGR